MKIVCADSMPFAAQAFGTLGTVEVLPWQQITPAKVRDADALAIRSTLTVDKRLLEGSRVRFVGTATIGTDHMDTAYLDERSIAWCYSPGCNANSVAEYIVCALLCLSRRHGLALGSKSMGIIGVGNVGGLVVGKCAALGLHILPNDPPRQEVAESVGVDDIFMPLGEVLAKADIVSMHVPLSRSGPHTTWHMADPRFFQAMKPGAVFVNSARGAAVDTGALLQAVEAGRIGHAVVDTWEGEPRFSGELLARCDLGTPHIAGHSFEGKTAGTLMVYRGLCEFLGVKPTWSPAPLMPPPPVPSVTVDAAGRRDEEVLWDITRRVYDIEGDDRRLRAGANTNADRQAANFDDLRQHYPERREFASTTVTLCGASDSLVTAVRALGFSVCVR